MANPLIAWLDLVDQHGVNIANYHLVFDNHASDYLKGYGVISLVSDGIVLMAITAYAMVASLVRVLVDPSYVLAPLASFLDSILATVTSVVPPLALATLGFTITALRFVLPRLLGEKNSSIRNSINVVVGGRVNFAKYDAKHRTDFTRKGVVREAMMGMTQSLVVFFVILLLTTNPLSWLMKIVEAVATIGSDFTGQESATGSYTSLLGPLTMSTNFGEAPSDVCANTWYSAMESGADSLGSCGVSSPPLTLLLALFFLVVIGAYTYFLAKVFARGSLFFAYSLFLMLVLPYRLGWEMFKPTFGTDKRWYDTLIGSIYSAATYMAFFLLCVFLLSSGPFLLIAALSAGSIPAVVQYLLLTLAFYFAGKNAWRINPKTEDGLAQDWASLRNRVVIRVGDNGDGSVDLKRTVANVLTGNPNEFDDYTLPSNSGYGSYNPRERELMEQAFAEAFNLKDEQQVRDKIRKSRSAASGLKATQRQRDKVNALLSAGRITPEEAQRRINALDTQAAEYQKLIDTREEFFRTKDQKLKIVPVPVELRDHFGNRTMASVYEIEQARRKTFDTSLYSPAAQDVMQKMASIDAAQAEVESLRAQQQSLEYGTDAYKKNDARITALLQGIEETKQLRRLQEANPGSSLHRLSDGVVVTQEELSHRKRLAMEEQALDPHRKYFAQQAGLHADELPATLRDAKQHLASVQAERDKVERAKDSMGAGEYRAASTRLDAQLAAAKQAVEVLTRAEQSHARGEVFVNVGGVMVPEEEQTSRKELIARTKLILDEHADKAEDVVNYTAKRREYEQELARIDRTLARGALDAEHTAALKEEAKAARHRLQELENVRQLFLRHTAQADADAGQAWVPNPDFDASNPASQAYLPASGGAERDIRELVKAHDILPEVAKDYVLFDARLTELKTQLKHAEAQLAAQRDAEVADMAQEQVYEADIAKITARMEKLQANYDHIASLKDATVAADTPKIQVSPAVANESPERQQARAMYLALHDKTLQTLSPVTSVARTAHAVAEHASMESLQQQLLPATMEAVNQTSRLLQRDTPELEKLQRMRQSFIAKASSLNDENITPEDVQAAIAAGSVFVQATADTLAQQQGARAVTELMPQLLQQQGERLALTGEDGTLENATLAQLVELGRAAAAGREGVVPVSDAEVDDQLAILRSTDMRKATSVLDTFTAPEVAGMTSEGEVYEEQLHADTEVHDESTGFASGTGTDVLHDAAVASVVEREAGIAQASGSSHTMLAQSESVFATVTPGNEARAIVVEDHPEGTRIRESRAAGFELL